MATFEAQVEALTSLSLDGSSAPTQSELSQFLTEGAKEVIFPLIDDGKNVNLNLSSVQYMDSSGISV